MNTKLGWILHKMAFRQYVNNILHVSIVSKPYFFETTDPRPFIPPFQGSNTFILNPRAYALGYPISGLCP